MNKREKEVIQAQLDAEKAVIADIEKQYNRALKDIGEKVKQFDYDISRLDDALNADGIDDATRARLQSQKQSKIYQKNYQEALKGQVSGILDKLHADEYDTIDKYLSECYTDAFIGTAYDLAGQGIPVIMPIDQAAAVKAILTDSKVSKGLYNALGVDVNGLKKSISSEITRGIASGLSYSDIARNISNASKAPFSRAKVIARTEGHRIQQASTADAQKASKARGADVVKQWNSTLDGKTRPTHRELDGQIREVDEYFEVAGKKAKYPGDFNDPAEDCSCRCVSLTRARWALGEDELKTLQDRAKFFGLDKTKDFESFKDKFLDATKYESDVLRKTNIQMFAISKDANAKKIAAFKEELEKGNISLRIKTQKQNEHIEGTKQREARVKRDEENGKVSTYFYEGTDVEALIGGLFGTGRIDFDSEKSLFPVEFISLEKPVGKAYNYGTKQWVDVSRIAIQYGANGVHAYPVKDW